MQIGILEFGVYGFIAYVSFLMLVIGVAKDVPSGKSGSIIRSLFLVPGIICAGILAMSGIDVPVNTSTSILQDLNTTDTWKETVSNTIPIQNPIWQTVHFLLFIVMVVYVITQVLDLLTKEK